MAVVINGIVYENLVQIIAKSNALDDSFIEGNQNVVSFVLDAKFTSTLTSLRCFPNLATFVIMNTDGVVTLNPNLFDGTSISRIIVPNSLLSAYQTAYPSWALIFDTWQFQVEFTIEHIAGQSTTLTKEYIDEVVAIAGGSAYAQVVTKLIVDSDFTDYEAGALDYLFEVFDNMTDIESPWLNGNTTDGMEWTIPEGESTTLTAEYVQSRIDDCVSDYAHRVIVTSYYTEYGNAVFDALDNINYTAIELELRGGGTSWTFLNLYTSSLAKIKKVVDARTSVTAAWGTAFSQYPNALDEIRAPYLTSLGNTYLFRRDARTNAIGSFVGDLVTAVDAYALVESHILSVSLPAMTTVSERIWDDLYTEHLYIPAATSISQNFETYNHIYGREAWLHIYLGTANCTTVWTGTLFNGGREKVKFYVPAQYLLNYVDGTNGANWQNWFNPSAPVGCRLFGFLDYTDTIPTFSGYTDTWYEDEDCTTPIATTDFVSGTRYFVKLTALITFTIGGQSYNATPNMTWQQWVASAYNTIGFAISNNVVTDGGSHGVSTTMMGQDWVDPSATISATDYYLVAL